MSRPRRHVYVVVLAIASSEPAGAQPEPPVQDIEPEPVPAPPPAPATPAPVPTTPAPTPAPAEPQDVRVHTMDELAIPESFLRFGVNFFGDTSFAVVTPDKPTTSFAIGTLGVRLLGELGASLDALAELGFETTGAGPVADVEQLVLRWRKGPGQLMVGRFHTELGYWNTAYHHGLWLQTPIERPHVVRFEDDGGLVPAHWVGVHYTVKAAVGAGTLSAVLGVGNGRGEIVDDVAVRSDNNEAKAALFKIAYKTQTLEIGAGIVFDVIAPAPASVRPALPDERIYEGIGNVYLSLRTDGPVAVVEGYAFRHQADNASWTTLSGYALLGYAATTWLMPYAAVDVIRNADDDPFFAPAAAMAPPLDIVEGLVGVRVETSTWSALKIELQYTHHALDPDDDVAGVANWSFGL